MVTSDIKRDNPELLSPLQKAAEEQYRVNLCRKCQLTHSGSCEVRVKAAKKQPPWSIFSIPEALFRIECTEFKVINGN